MQSHKSNKYIKNLQILNHKEKKLTCFIFFSNELTHIVILLLNMYHN